jgi:hypothetical protein
MTITELLLIFFNEFGLVGGLTAKFNEEESRFFDLLYKYGR